MSSSNPGILPERSANRIRQSCSTSCQKRLARPSSLHLECPHNVLHLPLLSDTVALSGDEGSSWFGRAELAVCKKIVLREQSLWRRYCLYMSTYSARVASHDTEQCPGSFETTSGGNVTCQNRNIMVAVCYPTGLKFPLIEDALVARCRLKHQLIL